MSKTILIVDDDRESACFLKNGLQRHGFEVWVASDGVEAKEQIRLQVPEVMLLDLVMPRFDGWQLLQWLRLEGYSIPTIVVSAQDRMDDLKRGVIEADTYLVKPVTIEDVIRAVAVVRGLEKKDG